jgi:hypothetical protein
LAVEGFVELELAASVAPLWQRSVLKPGVAAWNSAVLQRSQE